MQKEKLRKELENSLKNTPWTYIFSNNERLIEISNIKTESEDERKFLEDLKKEDFERVINTGGDVSYLIKRSENKLWINLTNKNGKVKMDKKEIDEKDALNIFKESKKEPRSLSNIFSFFSSKTEKRPKEFAKNKLKIKYKTVESIKSEKNSVAIIGKNYVFKLRGDGGLLFFNK